MKHFTILAAMLTLLLTSCTISIRKKAEVTQKEFKAQSFTGICVESYNDINISFSVSDTFSIKGEGYDDDINRLSITYQDGSLHITQKDIENNNERVINRPYRQTMLYISAPTLRKLDHRGYGFFVCHDTICTDNINLKKEDGFCRIKVKGAKKGKSHLKTNNQLYASLIDCDSIFITHNSWNEAEVKLENCGFIQAAYSKGTLRLTGTAEEVSQTDLGEGGRLDYNVTHATYTRTK